MIEIIQKTAGDFWKPTPLFWRKTGYSLLGVSSFIVGFGIALDYDWIDYSALGIGVVGKFLTNFFTDE